jgi:hypothetical protein
MDEKVKRPEETKDVKQNDYVRRWGIRIAALLVAFLLGLVPMWLVNRGLTEDLDQTKRELRRSQIQNTLSSAAIDARRGEYEAARQSASSFFTNVRAELDNSDSHIFNTQEKTQITGLMAGRDDIITLVSRSDPATAERLTDLYVEFQKATSAPQ